MTDEKRENIQLRAALEDAKALAESRRLELVKMSSQLDELLRLAAMQNEQLSDLRTMMRRKMARRRKGATDAPADSEGDQARRLPTRLTPKVLHRRPTIRRPLPSTRRALGDAQHPPFDAHQNRPGSAHQNRPPELRRAA